MPTVNIFPDATINNDWTVVGTGTADVVLLDKDYSNYIKADGYIEDGSGAGDKNKDTILAQLADGEFVSRGAAILGAGIIEGASPKDEKDMRKKGADFFYKQQAKFKRIFDLLDASKKRIN